MDERLPKLRQELRLEHGIRDAHGHQHWRIYDPCQHRFYDITDEDLFVLRHWQPESMSAFVQRIAKLKAGYTQDKLQMFLSFLNSNQLLQSNASTAKPEDKKPLKLAWTEVPLFDPNPMLLATDRYKKNLPWRSLLLVWSLLTGFGLWLVIQQWDTFINTFSYFFSFQGVVAFGVSLVALKFIHEFGHALVAHHLGATVGKVGVALFYGLPMLFTELSGVNRIINPQQRKWIALGGMAIETLVAGLATFLWAILPDGVLKSTAFIVCSTSWVTTLLLNSNPLARFDGYYFLSDLLEIRNFQPRAMAMARHAAMSIFVGDAAEAPERLAPPTRRGFILYGLGCWLYQSLLVLTIAFLFYTLVYETLGLLILAYFASKQFARPGWRFLKETTTYVPKMSVMRKTLLGSLIAAGLFAFFWPLERSTSIPATLSRFPIAVVSTPEPAFIKALPSASTRRVSEGELVVRFESPQLSQSIQEAELEQAKAQARLDRISGSLQERDYNQVLLQELERAQKNRIGLLARENSLEWTAPRAGVISDWQADIAPGQWVTPDHTIATLYDPNRYELTAYIPAALQPRLIQEPATFIPHEPSLPRVDANWIGVEQTASYYLDDPILSSTYGGEVESYEDARGGLVTQNAYYKGRLISQNTGSFSQYTQQVTGTLTIDLEPKSYALQVWEHLWPLLLRELRE
jgi:putative peptide zinc metalloprotease protein